MLTRFGPPLQAFNPQSCNRLSQFHAPMQPTPPDDRSPRSRSSRTPRRSPSTSAPRCWSIRASAASSPIIWRSIRYNEREGLARRARSRRARRFQMDPASAVLHYAQEIFEGLKAYRLADGGTALFRPDANARALPQLGASGMAMARAARGAVPRIVPRARAHRSATGFPTIDGGALYLRPFMIASEVFLGVKPSAEYHLHGHRLVGRRLFQGRRAGGLALGVGGLYARRARRHGRGQVRRQLRRQPDRAGRGDRARAATRSCSSTRSSAAGSRNWAA